MAFYQDVLEPGASRHVTPTKPATRPATEASDTEAEILKAAAKTDPYSFERASLVYDLLTDRLRDWAMATPNEAKRDDVLNKLDEYEASRQEVVAALLSNEIAKKDAMTKLSHVAELAQNELNALLASRKLAGLGYLTRQIGQFDFSSLLSMAGPMLSQIKGALGPKAPKAAAAAPPAAPAKAPKSSGPSMGTIALIAGAIAIPIVLLLVMSGPSQPAYPSPPPRRR